MMQISILIKLEVSGNHFWKEATSQVDFLSNLHRHKFFIIAEKSVAHADRDIEFISYAHKIKKWFEDTFSIDEIGCIYFGGLSCESIAIKLLTEFDLISCEVWEDNEFGARVSR